MIWMPCQRKHVWPSIQGLNWRGSLRNSRDQWGSWENLDRLIVEPWFSQPEPRGAPGAESLSPPVPWDQWGSCRSTCRAVVHKSAKWQPRVVPRAWHQPRHSWFLLCAEMEAGERICIMLK